MKPGDQVWRKHVGTSVFQVRDVSTNDHGETMLVLEGFQELGWVEADIFELVSGPESPLAWEAHCSCCVHQLTPEALRRLGKGI